ncbi:MAG TPA: hypothetical protein VF656_18355 [Pyrinomonadaceae bacterium]|jgi:hypothetical protein
MSQHKITSVIVGDLVSVLLLLEGERVDLNYNGADTYNSTNTIEVSGALNIAFVARGVRPAAWSLTISEGVTELLKQEGEIGPGNVSTFATSVPIAQTANASVKGGTSKKPGGKGRR